MFNCIFIGVGIKYGNESDCELTDKNNLAPMETVNFLGELDVFSARSNDDEQK